MYSKVEWQEIMCRGGWGKRGNHRKDKLHFKFQPSTSRTKITHYKQNINTLIILHSLHIQFICILTYHFNIIYCNNDNRILITELTCVEFHRSHITSTGNIPCHVTSQYSIKYLANMVHKAYINSKEQDTFWTMLYMQKEEHSQYNDKNGWPQNQS
jgi:hypothetical protein